MRVLLSNDDGIHSKGLDALVQAFTGVAEVVVVAPDREQSAASHAISLARPLRLLEIAPDRWSVDGTPTDCIYVALHHILKNRRPDVVISGVNYGANLGDDVTYSGTVAAAMEGTLLGVPSIAISLVSRDRFDFGPAASFARALAGEVLAHGLPRGTLLNVNVPRDAPAGYAITRLGKRNYGSLVLENVDPRGRKYYWIGGTETRHDDVPGSDCNAVYDQGMISVTPLRLDLTQPELLPVLESWRVPGFQPAPR